MDQTAARALQKSVTQVVIGAVAVGALNLFLFRAAYRRGVSNPSVSFRHRLAISLGRFRSLAIVSLLATVCLDFFFTVPLFSLRLANCLTLSRCWFSLSRC